ncbi:hypothetical protein LINGRAHAP2_LOCUS4247, partial [Linum grandiflorum]
VFSPDSFYPPKHFSILCFFFLPTITLPPPESSPATLAGLLLCPADPRLTFVSVAQVLRTESSSSDYFIYNSDFLSYNESIPALRSDALLLPNQLYFLLPNSSLNSTLTAPQMADLVIRALAGNDRKELMRKLPKFIYDEEKTLEKTRKILTEKIAQLNSTIDDVSVQLRIDGDDVPPPKRKKKSANLDGIEAAI